MGSICHQMQIEAYETSTCFTGYCTLFIQHSSSAFSSLHKPLLCISRMIWDSLEWNLFVVVDKSARQWRDVLFLFVGWEICLWVLKVADLVECASLILFAVNDQSILFWDSSSYAPCSLLIKTITALPQTLFCHNFLFFFYDSFLLQCFSSQWWGAWWTLLCVHQANT